jgi:hypothetical protein
VKQKTSTSARVPKRRTKVPSVTYLVKFDPTRRKFVALDEEGNLLGTDLNKSRTIGSAYREAMRVSKDGAQVTVMVEDEKRRRKKECVVDPP